MDQLFDEGQKNALRDLNTYHPAVYVEFTRHFRKLSDTEGETHSEHALCTCLWFCPGCSNDHVGGDVQEIQVSTGLR